MWMNNEVRNGSWNDWSDKHEAWTNGAALGTAIVCLVFGPLALIIAVVIFFVVTFSEDARFNSEDSLTKWFKDKSKY